MPLKQLEVHNFKCVHRCLHHGRWSLAEQDSTAQVLQGCVARRHSDIEWPREADLASSTAGTQTM